MLATADFLIFAHQLADTAKSITLAHFRQPLDISRKEDGSPVTLADQKTEKTLRACIEQHYPSHGIIGEEQTAKSTQSEFEWIIDPIDGTKNFIAGLPLYGTLICLLQAGKPILSIIDIPAQNERWSASTNTCTVYQKNTQHTTAQSKNNHELNQAILCSTDYSMFNKEENQQASQLRESVAQIRYNGDCYLYAMLASGWIDIVLESDLKIYDFLPLIPIIEQSGGIITDWQGKPLHKDSTGQVIASANPTLHQAALNKLLPHHILS